MKAYYLSVQEINLYEKQMEAYKKWEATKEQTKEQQPPKPERIGIGARLKHFKAVAKEQETHMTKTTLGTRE